MRLLIVFLFYAFVNASFAALNGQVVGKAFVVNYDKGTYKGDNQNWSVAVASNGLTYFGNDLGLLEFDGSNWNLYEMPDKEIVRSVTIGDDGIVYVGSYQEFGYWYRLKSGQLAYESLSDRFLDQGILHNDEIWRILVHNGRTYFQSFSRIFVYDGLQVTILEPEASMVLLMKAGGRLFVHLVGRGLHEIIDETFRLMRGSEVFARDEIKVMLPFGGNRFLVGVSGKGLFIFDGNSFAPWKSPLNPVMQNLEFNNGISGNKRLVIGTIGSGLYILDENGTLQEHLCTDNYLQNNTILGMAFDPTGNLWAGLDQGIALVNLNAGMDFYVDPSGTMGSVYAAVLDGTDLLVGTNQGLYRYAFQPGEGYVRPISVTGVKGQVWDLKNIDGEILCGHTSGTYRIEKEKAVRISDVTGGFDLRRITDRNRDFLLQSTYSAFVVYTRKENHWTLTNSVAGLYEPISSHETDHLGNIWCSHATRGIYRIRIKEDLSAIESSLSYESAKGLPSGRQIGVAKVENRIIFTTGNGIFTWDDLRDTVLPYDQLNIGIGEFSKATQVIRAKENHYWFIHGNDIALFRLAGRTIEQVFSYDFGVQDLYLISRFPRIISLNEGLYLICLDNGFALFDEAGIRSVQQPAPVSIRMVSFIGRGDHRIQLPLVNGGKSIRIQNGYGNLSFSFSSASGYRHPLYRTRMIGLDPQWSEWLGESTISFTRLSAGDYEFQVIAKNVNGLESTPATFSFTVRPPWFGSVLAWILYGILLALSGVALRLLFLRRLKLHKRLIEQKEQESRRQEMLEAEQELIRLKNEKLEAEVNFKNTQLADFTMSIIKRNEQLIKIRDEFLRQFNERGSSYPKAFQERIIRLFDKQLSSEDDWNTFETHFDQAHQDFIHRLKAEFPRLTQSDLKLCAYLRLNITSKEIAHLLNISVRGVEVRRYRLRKRLNLSTESNLYEFLLGF